MKKHFLKIFILLIISVLSDLKAQNYAGHFTNREGKIDIFIKNKEGSYEVDFTKDGAFRTASARETDGILQGFFVEQDSIPYSLNYQDGKIFFTSGAYHVVLSKITHEERQIPVAYDAPIRKKMLEIPYPSGKRVFNTSGDFSFNLPDESWDFVENEGLITLQKEDLKGFVKIIPHEIASIEDARNSFIISDLYPGKFELASTEMKYGKQGVFRTYTGFDTDNRKVEFHLLTLVALEGKGIHIISGAHHNDYKPNYEIWNKMIANSFEFTK